MTVNWWETFFGIDPYKENRFINQWNGVVPHLNQLWGVKNAVWIDTNNAWEHFKTIPELRAVVDKRASMMSSNHPKVINSDGEELENHWLNDLIKRPNPLQAWADVVYSLSVNDALYSNSFGYSPMRTGGVRNLFVTLPSNKIMIETTGKTLKQMDVSGFIQRYKFAYDDNRFEWLTVEDIIYLTTTDGMNLVKPTSRIDALKYPLSNIKASYHKRNVLLENIGAIGILSAQKSDLGGAIPMTPEEKRDIQRSWFNRSKDELMITESQLNWQPMSYPTRDLMLFEELTEDKIALIDAFGLHYNLFSSEKGTTFTNVRDSIRMVYQDTIIPETQQMYDSMTHQMGLDSDGIRLIADFSHLPVLQDDEQTKFGAEKVNAETKNIQAQGVISLNAAVTRGEMTRENAVQTLVELYGHELIIANKLIQ